MGEENGEGRSLAETPTYAVATVITVLVSLSFLFQGTLKKLVKWLDRTKRKSLLSALDKIKEELMLFGLLSLLMGHWIIFVAKICVKSSVLSSRFFPCAMEKNSVKRFVGMGSAYSNKTVLEGKVNNGLHNYCPEFNSKVDFTGAHFTENSSLASQGHESLASYESLEQLHRFVFVLGVTHITYSFIAVALAMIKLCFSRQFWSSIHRADYMALRLGFITNHGLPTTYDFHNYMLRSMDEEFRDIVGVSVLLWIYAICCIFLNFHGSNFYFWLSFVPAINAFEMATFLWSLWEIKDPSCFMSNRRFIVIRLSFGVISQVWCSFITFPLYVIITQMGSRFKKTVVSENVRKSLSKWQRRVKDRQSSTCALLTTTSPTSLSSLMHGTDKSNSHVSISEEGSSSGTKDICLSYLDHHVPKTQGNAPFLSYENDHDQDHEVINDSSPPPLS
ncbi:hypothetical protein JHK86_002001 [Glycine max]|nr:hypothetical protein JHK86_002001 [Glycine max]